jgi:ligand-binding sensor domain-containing protein/two-component sensor histidine kinase
MTTASPGSRLRAWMFGGTTASLANLREPWLLQAGEGQRAALLKIAETSKRSRAIAPMRGGTSNNILRYGLLVLCLLTVRNALALDPRRPANAYLRANFTVEEGLPDNTVNAILQTRNGFLWVGTDGGLARFDGEHFTRIRFKAGNSKEIPVYSLLATPDNELWVGTDAGLMLIPSAALDHFDRSLVKQYHFTVGLNDQVMCLHLGHDGILWIGTNRGLYRLERGKIGPVIPEEEVSRVEEASDGRLLLVTGHGFIEWDGSRVTSHKELPRTLDVGWNEIYHVFEDRRGVTWFCTAAGVARREKGLFKKLTPYGGSMRPAFRVYEDEFGNIWTNTRAGLFRATDSALEPVAPGLQARCMYSDLDGDLWVGTANDGLIRFKNREIQMYTTADGLPVNQAMVVFTSHDGTLWVGNDCGGLSRFDGKRFHTYDEKNGMSNSCVRSMAEDSNHVLWVGTWGGGLNRFLDGRFTSYSRPEGLPSDVVHSIAAARDGSLWIATRDGMSHMQNGRFRNYTMKDGLSSDRIMSVYQDRGGGIWAGTSAGVDRLVGDRFAPVEPYVDSGDIPYTTLKEDSSGNLYALSPVSGISRIENNRLVSVYGAFELSGMIETREHEIWFGGTNGIFRVAASDLKRRELENTDPFDYTSFGRSDGLNSKECSKGQPNMAITPDGHVWVGTVNGLAMLTPGRLPRRNVKPGIFVEEVEVGPEKRAPGRELILRPGAYHVALHFTAVSLASPKNIRIQYRLDGVDPVWLDADPTRSALYTSVPVGIHAFHVRATNGDGVWDREGIVYDITQQPYFYETTGFQIGSVVAFGCVALFLYRFRVHEVTRRLNLIFDERLAERTRIARDFHDTLLQSFQGVLLNFHAVTYLLSDRPEVKLAVEKIVEQARDAITEGRNAVEGLRCSKYDGSNLEAAISRCGQELGSTHVMAHSPDFQVNVRGTAKNLSPIVANELYYITAEALRNAFQHAHSRRIEVDIWYYPGEFKLRIRDDGKGIDPNVLQDGRGGHYGIPGMRERTKLAGGRLVLWSEHNSGTEIELTVPASLAYARELDSNRLSIVAKIRRILP